MKITADCHVHSNTSPDAKDSIDTMCQAAIDLGLKHICFTNHHEIFPGNPTPDDYLLDFQAYDREIEEARDKYSDKLEILKGVEFGSPQQHPKEYEELLKKDLDMIIASLHFMPMDFGIYYLWSGTEYMLEEAGKYIIQRYYDEMESLTAVGGFQVLAHMDWPKYTVSKFSEVKQVNEQIFKNLLKNDAVVEINTKALAKGYAEFHPAHSLLDQYHDLGGQHLTIGSDAHNKDELAGYFDQVAAYLNCHNFQPGFFRNKKFIPLEQ